MFIDIPVDEYLDYFWLEEVLCRKLLWTFMYNSVWEYFYFCWIDTKEWNCWFLSKCVFNLIRNHQFVLQSGCPSYFFTENVYDNSSYYQYLWVCVVASCSLICLYFMLGNVEQRFWCLLSSCMHSSVKSLTTLSF